MKQPPYIANQLDRPLLRKEAQALRQAAKSHAVTLTWRRYDLNTGQWVDIPPTAPQTAPRGKGKGKRKRKA